MSRLVFSVSYDMSKPLQLPWSIPADKHTSTTLTLLSTPHVIEFTSTTAAPFLYDANGSLPKAGRVDGITQDEFGVRQYQFSGGNFAITKILPYLKQHNPAGLQRFLLSGNDTIVGSNGNDVLLAGKGNDIIEGGVGHNIIDGGSGQDTASYANATHAVTVILNGIATVGHETIDSDFAVDTLKSIENLIGSSFDDSLEGDGHNNILDGGLGKDVMVGGRGHDTYLVSLTVSNGTAVVDDTVLEYAKQGNNDKIELHSGPQLFWNDANLVIADNVEIFDARDTGSNAFTLRGNVGKNTLYGNDGNNILDGGEGVDRLIGGKGDDTYIVDLLNNHGQLVFQDSITEIAAGGIDTLKLRIADGLDVSKGLSLGLPVNIEIFDVRDPAYATVKFYLTGNAGNNTLYGNDAGNTLDGGAGLDTLSGGTGNDVYIVDNPNDFIIDAGGKDLLKINFGAAFAGKTYDLTGADVEDAVILGTFDANIIGNNVINTLTGNVADNVIEGGYGADTLHGGKGNDTLSYQHSAGAVTVSLADQGKTVIDSNPASDANGDVFDGFENLLGSAFDDTLTGDAGANNLDGGAGADVLRGGKGDDSYLIDNLDDSIIEDKDAGIDLVVSSLSFSLNDKNNQNLENLTLSDNSLMINKNIDAMGNVLDNILIGNSGNNHLRGLDGNDILDGGDGADSLEGGKGDDNYRVDLILGANNQLQFQDSLIENANEGIDTVSVYANRHLQSDGNTTPLSLSLNGIANLENLDASKTDIVNLNLAGNELNNLITGNAKDNVIDTGLGDDKLIGGEGGDSLIGGDGADSLLGGAGKDSLTGGAGADLFWFDTTPTDDNQDHITDFSHADADKINLSRLIYQNAGNVGQLASSEFLSSSIAPSATAVQHLIYNSQTGELFYNSDGSGNGAPVLIAILDQQPNLVAADLWLI